VLGDQFADHFEVAELLDCDVLQHVANSCILYMEELHPILQGSGQLPRRAAELFEQIYAEPRIGPSDGYGLEEFFGVQKHRLALGWG